VPRFSLRLYLLGLAVHGVGGLWYGAALAPVDRAYLLSPERLPLTILAAVFPAVPLLFIFLQRGGARPLAAFAAGLGQFVALGLHAVVRQLLQNWELARYVDVAHEPVNLQWSPLVMFLLTFLFGLGLICWMLLRVAAVNRRELASISK
jgi:hypothetical protein